MILLELVCFPFKVFWKIFRYCGLILKTVVCRCVRVSTKSVFFALKQIMGLWSCLCCYRKPKIKKDERDKERQSYNRIDSTQSPTVQNQTIVQLESSPLLSRQRSGNNTNYCQHPSTPSTFVKTNASSNYTSLENRATPPCDKEEMWRSDNRLDSTQSPTLRDQTFVQLESNPVLTKQRTGNNTHYYQHRSTSSTPVNPKASSSHETLQNRTASPYGELLHNRPGSNSLSDELESSFRPTYQTTVPRIKNPTRSEKVPEAKRMNVKIYEIKKENPKAQRSEIGIDTSTTLSHSPKKQDFKVKQPSVLPADYTTQSLATPIINTTNSKVLKPITSEDCHALDVNSFKSQQSRPVNEKTVSQLNYDDANEVVRTSEKYWQENAANVTKAEKRFPIESTSKPDTSVRETIGTFTENKISKRKDFLSEYDNVSDNRNSKNSYQSGFETSFPSKSSATQFSNKKGEEPSLDLAIGELNNTNHFLATSVETSSKNLQPGDYMRVSQISCASKKYKTTVINDNLEHTITFSQKHKTEHQLTNRESENHTTNFDKGMDNSRTSQFRDDTDRTPSVEPQIKCYTKNKEHKTEEIDNSKKQLKTTELTDSCFHKGNLEEEKNVQGTTQFGDGIEFIDDTPSVGLHVTPFGGDKTGELPTPSIPKEELKKNIESSLQIIQGTLVDSDANNGNIPFQSEAAIIQKDDISISMEIDEDDLNQDMNSNIAGEGLNVDDKTQNRTEITTEVENRRKEVKSKLDGIEKNAIRFEDEIINLEETEDSNKYYYIEESLRRLIDKLDDMYDDIGEDDYLRQERKAVYKSIFLLFDKLDNKVSENKMKYGNVAS